MKICACGNNTFKVLYDPFTSVVTIICAKCDNEYCMDFQITLDIKETTKDKYTKVDGK